MIFEGKKNSYEVVIGLEVHTQIKTKAKLFSNTPYEFGIRQNECVSFYDAGMPGMLPVLNFEAVRQAIKTGIAINATVNKFSSFDRKNYFYPDLPSGYQITQFFHPIVSNGYLDIILENGLTKRISIERIHLEQDAGKLVHGENRSCVDLNRAGVPLMEIVSKPDLRSPNEAVSYLKKLHGILRAVDSSDADMEKGSFRCDVNVSIMPVGSEVFGTRCEVKNVNSFKFIKDAIEYEVYRQINIVENGGNVEQQTMLYDSEKNETYPIRSKEDAADYRYFPDPDLLPIVIDDALINKIRSEMPEMPEQKKKRYTSEYGFLERDADALIEDKDSCLFFEKVVKNGCDPKLAFSWIMVELLGRLNKAEISFNDSKVNPDTMSDLIKNISNGSINGKIAKEILDEMVASGKSASEIIEEKGLKQMDNASEIESFILKVLSENPDNLAEYRSGKERLFGFFVGQVMKITQGKANPQLVNDLLKKHLDSK